MRTGDDVRHTPVSSLVASRVVVTVWVHQILSSFPEDLDVG